MWWARPRLLLALGAWGVDSDSAPVTVSLPSFSFHTGEPRGSRGSMIGVINGQEFGVATLNTSVHQEAGSGVTTIQSSISYIPTRVGKWGPLPPTLGPAGGRVPALRLVQGLVPRGCVTAAHSYTQAKVDVGGGNSPCTP